MKKFLFCAPLFAALSLAGAQVAPQTNVKETQEIASRSLGVFRELAKQDHFRELGFESADEASSATLGSPISVSMVTLEDLRAFQPGADVEKLLKPLDKLIYPVSAGGQVRSSIVVQKNSEGWGATDFGSPNLIKLLTAALQQSMAASQLPAEAHFVVQVPALNAYFIAYRASGKLTLASVIDDPALKLSAGRAIPAEQVFADLVAAAKAHDDLPR